MAHKHLLTQSAANLRGSPTAEDIVEALRAICAPRTVEPLVA